MEPLSSFSFGSSPAPGPGAFRLLYVQAGAVRLINSAETSVLGEGSLLLLPPGSPGRIICDPGSDVRSISFIRSLVDPLVLNGSVDMVVEMLGTCKPTIARLTGRARDDARSLFSSMEKEASARTAGFQSMLRLKLMELVLLLARARMDSHSLRPIRFHPAEAMEHIQAHSSDPLTLDGLAARYGLNASYFSRLFSSRAGMPLVEYINRIRIRKSCLLLKRSDASVMEIALAVGYNNLSHFNRYFRRLMGKSPREYRASSRR